jgi:hypothetical protein
MSLDNIALLPGKKDINNQFTSGTNLRKVLACFKKLEKNGTYEFGLLTACYYNFSKEETEMWLQETKIYPQQARDAIKDCIIKALTNKDKDGNDDPIPVTLVWTEGPDRDVKCTFNPSPPSYTIDISGYIAPMASALAERRER